MGVTCRIDDVGVVVADEIATPSFHCTKVVSVSLLAAS
jgi:hypothetical protein